MTVHYIRQLGLILLLTLASSVPSAEPGFWLRADTGALTLTLMRGEQPLRVFRNIAIGRYGAATDKRLDDNQTPLGRYRITHITTDTRYHLFMGIDYPNAMDARRGLAAGLIDRATYRAILAAIRAGRAPPQHTPLGGHLGIHGIGEGDPRIHADFNWTNGCIALTNAQIDELADWAEPGMTVVIE